MDYPLLTMVTTGVWLLMFTSIFIALGWCDPNEYKRKIGMDVFSGIMFFTSLKVLSKFSDIMYASVAPQVEGDPLISVSMIQSFSEGFYAQFNFASIFDKVDNELTALIVIGISIMLLLLLSVVSIIFGVYFIFRVFSLIDVYITNLIRYCVMAVAFIVMLIVGVPANQPQLLTVAVIIAIASIVKLAIGHTLLYFKEDIYNLLGKEMPENKTDKTSEKRHHQSTQPTQQNRTRQQQRPITQNTQQQRPQQRPMAQGTQQQRPQHRPIAQNTQQRPQQRPMTQGNQQQRPQQRPITQNPQQQRPQQPQQRPTQTAPQTKRFDDDNFAEQMRNMAMRYEAGANHSNFPDNK